MTAGQRGRDMTHDGRPARLPPRVVRTTKDCLPGRALRIMSDEQQDLPPYDLERLRAASYPERIRLVCRMWLYQINATPVPIYIGYVVKIALLFVGGWWFFCTFTPGMGSPADFTSWAFTSIAFQKAVLWALTYEGLGFGCSTGPMTGRFIPPIGGLLHFLRPATTKLPYFPGLPVIGGTRRTVLDVALYAVIQIAAFYALTRAEITPALLTPIIILLPILGFSDKTVFLATRGEHYYTALVCIWCMASGPAWIAGSKMVWVAIWFWAATSKLNGHFPGVICVMLTNSPFIPAAFHRKLYKNFPDDLRPSRLAATIAHFGTVVEYTFPMVLLASAGGPATPWALLVMVSFHSFIAGNFPMGMPVEWNVAMVYGGFFLFGFNGGIPLAALGSTPLLLMFLIVMVVLIPLYGNFYPSRVSFLMSMRYYAGNWAYSVWLFRKGCERKLDRLVKAIPLLRDQLERIVPEPEMVDMAIAMQPSFRLAHLHGRVLHWVLPRAADDLDEYEWMDGEMVAGLALGWNFGDGHLHFSQLLEAIKEQCEFDEGELRVIMVESQPLFGDANAWVIADAARGVIDEGQVPVQDYIELQPWPTGAHAEALLPDRAR